MVLDQFDWANRLFTAGVRGWVSAEKRVWRRSFVMLSMNGLKVGMLFLFRHA